MLWGWSAAEHAGRDPEPGGGGGVAGVVLAVGDLAGDLAELGRDGALGGFDAFEAVEDLVVLGAAGGKHRDDVLDPAPADVRDVGLDVVAVRARSGGTAGRGGRARRRSGGCGPRARFWRGTAPGTCRR